jgi:hypothetical protein|tara:strand:- start:247 stop:618 length:372 start_codon:yes stop_codon:yes gene_type:complete
MEVKNKYYNKLPDGKWKVYIQLFTKKDSKQRLYLKPGITEFWDGDARMYFNNLTEEDSFIKHFDTKVMWSKIFPSKAEAEKVEKELLEYFGDKVDMGFKTGGYSEVREYNHEKWIAKANELYN